MLVYYGVKVDQKRGGKDSEKNHERFDKSTPRHHHSEAVKGGAEEIGMVQVHRLDRQNSWFHIRHPKIFPGHDRNPRGFAGFRC